MGLAAHNLPMNAVTQPERRTPEWQIELTAAFTRPAELLAYLQLPPDLPSLQLGAIRHFPLRVPRGFAARMEKGNAEDPLFKQIWPSLQEQNEAPAFTLDAVGDVKRLKAGGLIHKYQGRALVITTGACAVNCRYCFRRHFPYSEARAARSQWQALLDALRADPSIEEVILSGGDPLSLSDDKLAALAQGLDEIPHLKRLRIHTRQPVVLPQRVDDALLGWLTASRLQKIVVLHINHPNELDAEVGLALGRLRAAQIPLLNQAVLLRGINDSPPVLKTLSERLFAFGVLPYYLNLLDRVQGAAHYEVDEATGKALVRKIASELPGYLVPRLVRDVEGQPSKTWIHW